MSSNVFEACAHTHACAAKLGKTAAFMPAPLPPPSSHNCQPRMSHKLGDRPLLSVLHPKVFPADHFLSWLTPYGIAQNHSESPTFPHEITACRHFVITQAVKPVILTNYATGLVGLTKFCDDFNVPEIDCMPASELLLATFITTCGAGMVSNSAILSWLAGLQLWHLVNNAPWHGAALLKRAAEGSSRLAPGSSCRPKCASVTLQHIQALCNHLDLTDTFDAAIFAVACMAFWSCCRLGELLMTQPLTPCNMYPTLPPFDMASPPAVYLPHPLLQNNWLYLSRHQCF